MAGSTYGDLFRITTWGESHGKGLGVVIDGCPAGIEISEEEIQKDLDRRKPGKNKFTTQRNESDKVEIMSGVFEGKTTGTPISLVIFNNDQKSKDYSNIAEVFRPGHADMGFYKKFGIRDYRGGGRSSGRETAARVAAGAVARKFLAQLGIDITAYTVSIGNIEIDKDKFDINERFNNPFVMPDKDAAEKTEEYLKNAMENLDSVGGIVQCEVSGMKTGIGEPVFDKLDASLAKAILSIGATKGIEFGIGFEAGKIYGSQNNDEMYCEDGKIIKFTNNSGGILGGMSDGDKIVFRTVFKPTPSIAQAQKTVDIHGNEKVIEIKGRHDPIVTARAVVVVEAMTAVTIADCIMKNCCSRIEYIKKMYEQM
ncbi:MAG: chorismate synthase [Firmicutes bacterium]|nr:chorismate synthase [Bacillota bacterium]